MSSNPRSPSGVLIRANRASTAAWLGVVWALILIEDVFEDSIVVEVLLLLLIAVGPFEAGGLLLIAVGPLEADGQKFPVCCRQLNWVTTSGSTGVPSGFLTTSRKASFAMDPARGSCRAGHMIQGKPCEPSKLRCCSTANPFPSKKSNSLGVLMMGVPSKSVPFLAANVAKIFWPAGVKAEGV